MYVIRILLTSFGFTLLFELLTGYILGIRKIKDYVNMFLANLITNPLLVILTLYINLKYGLDVRNIMLIVTEIIVVIVEGIIYKKYLSYKKINPFLISLILNSVSFLLGEVINRIIY